MIPHLMFAHMLGDYVLQSNWLVMRKGKGWDGLALHGGIVGFMSLLVLAPYLDHVWYALIVLTVLHTLQDYLKVYSGPRLKVHPFLLYMADQLAHYALILLLNFWVEGRLSPAPDATETALMWTGTAVIAVTRYYEVTWWANWLDMIPYMNRWRTLSYLEHLAMLALASAGGWFIAPLCVAPRLVIAHRQGYPIGKQRRGWLEISLGIAFSILLGIGLRAAYAQI